MNKATIPIVARLQALQTVSRVASGGVRLIADARDRRPIAALLREVNETVLGRSLTFASSGGAQITLEVAGRRVLRLVAADVRGVAADSCLAAPVLEDTHKDALIAVLEAAAPRGHDLSVLSQPSGRDGDEVSVGLPVALLADLMLIDLDTLAGDEDATAPPEAWDPAEAGVPATGAMLQRFALHMGPSLMAWLVFGGPDNGASAGPEEMVSHLGGFLEGERAALSAQLDRVATTAGGTAALVLGASLQQGHCTLCARHGDGLLIGLIEGETARLAPRAWALAQTAG